MFRAYSRMLVFAAALLLGIQVPGFVEQYRQRVDAHFREVSANIAGFQRTADRMFQGNLRSLITYYERSGDQVFRSDAASLTIIVDRFERMEAEQARMSGNSVAVALHVLFAADEELFDETLQQYSYTVPLNQLSLFWGVGLALVLMLTLDCCWFGCKKCVGMIRRHRHTSDTIG